MSSEGERPAREQGLTRASQLIAAQDYAAAEVVLADLLERYPRDHEILLARGTTALARTDSALATLCFEMAVGIYPQRADTLCYLGVAVQMAGNAARAETCYRNSLALAPDCTQAAFELGALLVARGQQAEAHSVWWTAGRALVARARSLEAAALFSELIKLAPGDVAAVGILAALYLDMERPAQARACFDRVLELDADNAEAWHGLGILESQDGNLPAARRFLQRAVAQRRVFPTARNALGNVHARLGDSAAAIKQYQLAVRQAPKFADAWVNLADELTWIGQHEAALDACANALAVNPNHALAQVRSAYLWLAEGKYERGWPAHEWRIAAALGTPYLPHPSQPAAQLPRPTEWRHENLRGCRLLILPEEGVGDELFCLRFLAPLLARGVTVLYQASDKMRLLLETTANRTMLLSPEDPVPAFDQALAFGDLGLVALAQGGPAEPPPYPLHVAHEICDAERLSWSRTADGPYLGLTWRAGKAADGVRRKYIDLATLARSLKSWPGSLVALQRDSDESELSLLGKLSGRPVIDRGAAADDLSQAVVILAGLDEYAGVSNTNMHLCTSLGRSARVLVGPAGEWRWRRTGSESPWMPGIRIYRAQQVNDWRTALAELATDLGRR